MINASMLEAGEAAQDRITTDVRVRRYLTAALAGAAALFLAACGEGGALPDYDEDATYNGKTLSEYTPGLSDLNAQARMQALINVGRFGVNGLPAREKVQEMARGDKDPRVKIVALAILSEMQDPALKGMMKEFLADPAYATEPGMLGELATGAGDTFTPEELEEIYDDIADDNLDHAQMIYNAPNIRKSEVPLAKALMGRDVNQRTLNRILSSLPRLQMDENEKVAFVVDNADKLGDKTAALRALQALASDPAFDAALRIVKADKATPFQQKIQVIQSFGGTVDQVKVINVLAEFASDPSLSEQDFRAALAALSGKHISMSRVNAVRTGKTDDPQYAAFLAADEAFGAALIGLLKSDDATRRALAARELVIAAIGANRHVLDSETLLTPVLAHLGSENEEIVLGTITQQLVGRPSKVQVPEGSDLPAKIAAAVFSQPSDSEWAHAVSDGVLKMATIWFPYKKVDRLDMIRRVTDEAKNHPDHPGNPVVLEWIFAMTQHRQIAPEFGADILDVASRAGNLMLLSGVTQGHVHNWFQRSNVGNLTIATQAPSTDAIMAFMEPIVMSQDPKFLGSQGSKSMFDMILGTNIYYLRGHADQAKYIEWVRKVQAGGHNSLRPVATKGLKQFAK